MEWLLLPVYVFWNMIGTTKVMNELIVRANGPEAAVEIIAQVGWTEGLSEAITNEEIGEYSSMSIRLFFFCTVSIE